MYYADLTPDVGSEQNGHRPVLIVQSNSGNVKSTCKLKISSRDIKAVQDENGQKDAKMVTHQYSWIFEEDRSRIAGIMDEKFYGKKDRTEEYELMQAARDNPDLFKQFMAFMSIANANKAM